MEPLKCFKNFSLQATTESASSAAKEQLLINILFTVVIMVNFLK